MVRIKMSTKPPPHWTTHSSAAGKRQQTKKGRQSKVAEDESWLLLPEPVAHEADLEAFKPTEVAIPPPVPGTPVHAAWKIPVGEIIQDLYHHGCPPTNKELVAHAEIFVISARKADAMAEYHDAAEVVLNHLACTIMSSSGNGRSLLAIITAKPTTAKPVTEKPETTKPAPKRVRELREGTRKSKRIRLSKGANEDDEISARLSPQHS
ncbi:hypothetical protein QBC32DRAFT_319560 [Pseudoneurospora amorphoporcata]|uniref:Uncharacterized protein n=1 Tax=Pseudoneurospora amorphoporcata TaxID=241081 RepID=A0AAN6NKJ6_9PEZI|nr:hypothetical protein QBC32DRAFT_319560 [Pseudoneurospora amorphoporcata]